MKIYWFAMLWDFVEAMFKYLPYLFGMVVGFILESFWIIVLSYFVAVILEFIFR